MVLLHRSDKNGHGILKLTIYLDNNLFFSKI